MSTSTDQIEKQIDLEATISRVWRALTDPAEFGEWFGVSLTGQFSPGARVHGKMTIKECEHMDFAILVATMEPERLFSYRWHPLLDSNTEQFEKHSTLVEFKLEPLASGTRLTVIESGFDRLPPDRREEAFLRNEGGWVMQLKNIEQHVA
jgi:uncharacterized protein YndB with AHSA1/START domain